MNRRRFIITSIAALPALPALSACRRGGALQPPGSCAVAERTRGPGKTLDEAQWETVRAACARLLPTDQEAGATEGNVVNFIDSQLAHPPVSAFRVELALGLQQLDQLARGAGARRFVELTPDGQDQVLGQLQKGVRLGPDGRRRRPDSRHFFVVLLSLTLEGFLGHPIYGGNRDRVGWRFFGFDPRPPHPRCPARSGALELPSAAPTQHTLHLRLHLRGSSFPPPQPRPSGPRDRRLA